MPFTTWTTASAMFLAWSPMRSIDFAMNTISSAGRDRPRILHHVADELAHDRQERRVDLLVAVDHLGGGGGVEPRERVERHLQHLAPRLGGARSTS